jgi:hypothetical protein
MASPLFESVHFEVYAETGDRLTFWIDRGAGTVLDRDGVEALRDALDSWLVNENPS